LTVISTRRLQSKMVTRRRRKTRRSKYCRVRTQSFVHNTHR
jgi:hypothetical protein